MAKANQVNLQVLQKSLLEPQPLGLQEVLPQNPQRKLSKNL
jgi:hypothetical protein